MNYQTIRLINRFNAELSHSVKTNFPRSWDENTISYSLCRTIKRFLNRQIIFGLNRSFNVSTDAFKLNGESEKKHGDIAVLISINNWDGKILQGTGFLEAKKRYDESGKYEAIDFAQLQRIYENTPHAQLILYSHESITDYEAYVPIISELDQFDDFNYTNFGHQTNVGAMPLNLGIELNNKSTLLHKYTYPLAFQIIGRFLHGYDLHFDTSINQKVANYPIEKWNQLPQYVLSFGVSYDSEEIDLIRPSGDQYSTFE